MNKSFLIASTVTILVVLGIVVYRPLWAALQVVVRQASVGCQNYLRAGDPGFCENVTTPPLDRPNPSDGHAPFAS
jgi:hypothetical protein